MDVPKKDEDLQYLLEKGGVNQKSAAVKIWLARLFFERGDILHCVELLEPLRNSGIKNTELYLECSSRLLQSYAELQDQEKIQQLKQELNKWAEKKGDLTPRAYYTLALCESRSGRNEVALELCHKSMNLAIRKNSKRDICYAITGIAIANYQLGRLQEALKETYNLQIFDVLSFPKLHLTTRILQAHIYRKLKKYTQAIESLWVCYEMIKKEKDFYTYFALLYGLGLTYKEMGDLEKARVYLELGLNSIDNKNMCHLHKTLSELLKEVQKAGKSSHDIVYDVQSHVIIEKTKGKINFKNQFILLEMLKLFLAHPGRVFSKNELIETIWKQDYNPSVHDNKIYVTIKRLRKLIEPDYNKPKYIFLAKNGYYLNKDIKFQFRDVKRIDREKVI